MTPLPAALGGKGLIVWRIETTKHLPTWQSAEGAFLFGGRWNSAGKRVIYTSIDPSTAIVEVGVHKGFNTLDGVSHTLLAISLDINTNKPAQVHVLDPTTIPNPAWLRPGAVSAEQQKFGDSLLAQHAVVVVPSVVSSHAWNLLVNASHPSFDAGLFKLHLSERFALDARLNPPAAASAGAASSAVPKARKARTKPNS